MSDEGARAIAALQAARFVVGSAREDRCVSVEQARYGGARVWLDVGDTVRFIGGSLSSL